MNVPTARTKVAAVIGDPVAHSRSPAIHNAAFAATSLDWVYVAFTVSPGDGPAAVHAMRTTGLAGMSVTMPHKHDVLSALDVLSAQAKLLGAVNCISWENGELVGHNTDGAGLIGALADAGIDPSGARAVVVGAGGAGRASTLALVDAGVADLSVLNRGAERRDAAVALAGAVGRPGSLEDVRGADIVVNATPVGMAGSGGLPVPAEVLHEGQVVVDLVYEPLETELLEVARARGAIAVDGLGMLVHQAAVAFELWTGVSAPIDAMKRAATLTPRDFV